MLKVINLKIANAFGAGGGGGLPVPVLYTYM